MATAPAFASTINRGSAALSTTADTAVATAGSTITPTTSSFVTLFTAGANGSKVEEITVIPTGTVTACTVRIYVYNGSNYYLRDVYTIAAYTNSTTTAPTPTVVDYSNLELKSGDTLVASCTVAAEPLTANAFGGDL